MKEMLKMFSDEGELLGEMEKKVFHETMRKQFAETGTANIRHRHVRLLLMTSNGRVILQRRSKWKGDNAGMWDKTIGGHVAGDDSFDLTMLKECAEELGIPATVVSKEEFEHTTKVTDLHVLAVLTKLSYLDNFKSKRKDSEGNTWVEPTMNQFYIGYYNGAIRFMDSESCGIQVFSKSELIKELEEAPDSFTEDIKYILEKFADKIKPIEGKIDHVLSD
ncbi:MAG: NUDIX domain-containing protein [archaeon]|jgi:isopentenyldiphosphate isomerase